MLALLRQNHDGVDLRPTQKLADVGRKEVGLCILGKLPAKILLHVTETQPLNARVLPRKSRPNTADRAAANDRQADLIQFFYRHLVFSSRFSTFKDSIIKSVQHDQQ